MKPAKGCFNVWDRVRRVCAISPSAGLVSAMLAITSTPAAAYDIDCKVILCLAGGFPSGCGDAKSYMVKRLKRGKPPFGFCPFGSGMGEGTDYHLDMGQEQWTRCPGGYRTYWVREEGMVTRCQGGLEECSQSYMRITIPEDDGGVFDSGRQRWGHPWCQAQDRGQ